MKTPFLILEACFFFFLAQYLQGSTPHQVSMEGTTQGWTGTQDKTPHPLSCPKWKRQELTISTQLSLCRPWFIRVFLQSRNVAFQQEKDLGAGTALPCYAQLLSSRGLPLPMDRVGSYTAST